MIFNFYLESGWVRMQKFIEGVRENGFLQILLQDGGAESLFMEINILSSKLGEVCVTITKIMAEVHI